MRRGPELHPRGRTQCGLVKQFHTLLAHRVGFAAFRHPCTTTSTCCGAAKRHGNSLCNRPDPTLAWWETEARIVERRNITANLAALRAQVARYEAYGIAFGQ